jgi:hypothetical protein
MGEVDAIAAKGDSLLPEQPQLPSPLGDAPIRADHPMPRQILGRGGQYAPDQSGSVGVDVAVGSYEAGRYGPDAVDDQLLACPVRRHPHSSTLVIVGDKCGP